MIISLIVALLSLGTTAAAQSSGEVATTQQYIQLHALRDQSKMQKLLRQCLERISQGDYDKAERQLTEFRRKTNTLAYGTKNDDVLRATNPYVQALAPLYQLAEAWLNLRPADYDKIAAKPDYWRAQQLTGQAMRMGQARIWANSILADKKIATSVEQLARQADSTALQQARQEATEAAYNRFMTNASTDNLIELAIIEREAVAFDQVKRAQRLDECERYLDTYSGQNASHQAEITRLAEQYAFEGLGFTVQSCKDYLERYPSAPQAATVRERMYKYAFNELKPSVASCKAYLHDYPLSPYVSEVTQLLFRYAYQEMADTPQGWAQYVAQYPESPYCQQLRDKLLRNDYDQAIAAGTVDAYAQFLQKHADSGYAIEIARRLKDLTSTPEEINAEVRAIEAETKAAEKAEEEDKKEENNNDPAGN